MNPTCGPGLCRIEHERGKADEDGLNAPSRIPTLWVEVRHTEAKPGVGLKTARRCQHVYGWGLQRILLWEHKLAPIDSAIVWSLGWQVMQHVVPYEHVLFCGAGDDV